ncbi:MAG: hypothetical protein AAF684_06385 [Pseudomonadota bacterium]
MRASRIAAIAFAVLAFGVVAYQHFGVDDGAGVEAPAFGTPTLLGPTPGRSFANRLIATPDGGALLAGQSDDAGWLLRLDADLSPVWSDRLTVRDGAKASLFAAAADLDGAVFAAGSAWSNADAPALILRRYEADGAPGWETVIEPGGFFAQAQGVARLDGGALHTAGAAFGRETGPNRLGLVARFSADGAQRWLRNDLDGWPEAVTGAGVAGYVAGWTPTDAGDEASAFWVARLDDAGALIWARSLRDGAADRALAMAASAQRVFASGFQRDGGNAIASAVVAAYDPDGAPLWRAQDVVDDADAAFDRLALAGDGGVVAAGYVIRRADGVGALILSRFGPNGETLWRRTIARTAQLNAISGVAVIGDSVVLAVSAAGDSRSAQVALFQAPLR